VGAETVMEKVNLQVEAPPVHVVVKVGQVGIVDHRLVERLPAEALCQNIGEGGLSHPDVARDADESFHAALKGTSGRDPQKKEPFGTSIHLDMRMAHTTWATTIIRR